MGNKTNQKKASELGMPFGTATARLRKAILFSLLQKYGENVCFRCSRSIVTVAELSLDHKQPWFGVSPDLFWDLSNIAFSHAACNRPDRPYRTPRAGCGYGVTYDRHGCRCEICSEAKAKRARRYRAAKKARKL